MWDQYTHENFLNGNDGICSISTENLHNARRTLRELLIYDILKYIQRSLILNRQKQNFQPEWMGVKMAVSYKKLWKLLIDRDMKKKDLCAAAGVSHASMAKLGKNENVTTDVLVKICTALNCDIGDIMELVPENTK